MGRKAFKVLDGSRSLFDDSITHICDACGLKIAKPGRHPACDRKVANCKNLVKDWAMRAMQREVATGKRQTPPLSLQALARAAGVNIDTIAAEAICRARKGPHD